jgi:hypothetical protein
MTSERKLASHIARSSTSASCDLWLCNGSILGRAHHRNAGGRRIFVPPEPHDSWVVGDEPYPTFRKSKRRRCGWRLREKRLSLRTMVKSWALTTSRQTTPVLATTYATVAAWYRLRQEGEAWRPQCANTRRKLLRDLATKPCSSIL